MDSSQAITMVATRMIVTTCVASPGQAATTPRNRLPLLYQWRGGSPSTNRHKRQQSDESESTIAHRSRSGSRDHGWLTAL